jgi:hypothetical protein
VADSETALSERAATLWRDTSVKRVGSGKPVIDPSCDPKNWLSRQELDTELRSFAEELPELLACLAWDPMRLEQRIHQILSVTADADIAYVHGSIKALILRSGASIPDRRKN